ncbi:magnesium transporter CorA family protein [Roseivivax sp. CAU 1761]
MIRIYQGRDGTCRIRDGEAALAHLADAAWIDLADPDAGEIRAIESALEVTIPTRDQMAEIEISSRLYHSGSAAVMTLPLLVHSTDDYPDSTDLTFVLSDRHLVTLRYAEPASLTAFAATAARTPAVCESPPDALAGLLDAVVDRLADVMEALGRELDLVGREVTTRDVGSSDLRRRMQQLSRTAEIASKTRESLVALGRLAAFAQGLAALQAAPRAGEALTMVARDVEMLLEHETALSAKVTFLLDALLGLITIEQNDIIKTFSVVAVMFLPPTLIASIYGMNFEHMPELDWRIAYPLVLGAMVGSMIAPYLFFKRKGWI